MSHSPNHKVHIFILNTYFIARICSFNDSPIRVYSRPLLDEIFTTFALKTTENSKLLPIKVPKNFHCAS